MPANGELAQIRQRKALLLARSDGYRRALQLESRRLSQSLAWIDRARSWVRAAYPLMLALAPIAGFFAIRRHRVLRRALTKGLLLGRLLWKLRRLWAPGRSAA